MAATTSARRTMVANEVFMAMPLLSRDSTGASTLARTQGIFPVRRRLRHTQSRRIITADVADVRPRTRRTALGWRRGCHTRKMTNASQSLALCAMMDAHRDREYVTIRPMITANTKIDAT